jgi:shikimate kinase
MRAPGPNCSVNACPARRPAGRAAATKRKLPAFADDAKRHASDTQWRNERMIRVLLTGMSGTGKSSVVAALRRRGFMAIDMDEPGWSVRDDEGHQLWCEERLHDALAAAHDRVVFVSGCAANQVNFYPEFSRIVLLSAPAETLMQRLAARTSNRYGQRPDELAEVMHHLETIEPLLRRRATHEIVTTMPLDRVVDAVLSIAGIST